MALLTPTQLKTLDIPNKGLPFCNISLIGDTYSLDYSFKGLPFIGHVETTSYLCKVLVSGVWKDVSEGYVLVNGAWKSVTELYVLVSGSWEVHA